MVSSYTLLKWNRKTVITKIFTLIVALCALSTLLQASTFEGRVVAVSDGDTIQILTNQQKKIKIRLIYIDAPERDQPYGQKAKQILSEWIYDQWVVANSDEKDQYGRALAKIYLGDEYINARLIEGGHAWVYKHYAQGQKKLFELEDEARAEKRGLWALPPDQRIPPWEWRRKEAPAHRLDEPRLQTFGSRLLRFIDEFLPIP